MWLTNLQAPPPPTTTSRLLPEYSGGWVGAADRAACAPRGDFVKGEAKRNEQLSQATCLLHQL